MENFNFNRINKILKGQIKNGENKDLKKACYHLARPVFDIFSACVLLLFATPVLIISAPIIKITSKGPIFYTQIRVGENSRLFRIIKLRTMFENSENENDELWAKDEDKRVTKFGKILRKTHLDELPQLFNVIKGDMSIIGPRPERPLLVKKFKTKIQGYDKRLTIKPGITGLAQCYYKYDESERDVCKKLRYDLLYLKKMSLVLDTKIVVLTAVVSFIKRDGKA